jgi:Fe-S cluster biogenesis protein NfuA
MAIPEEIDHLKNRVAQILREEIAPALELDPAGIEVFDVHNGVVRLKLGAICSACPSTVMTVIMGLEQELRRRIPEIEYLEAVP